MLHLRFFKQGKKGLVEVGKSGVGEQLPNCPTVCELSSLSIAEPVVWQLCLLFASLAVIAFPLKNGVHTLW